MLLGHNVLGEDYTRAMVCDCLVISNPTMRLCVITNNNTNPSTLDFMASIYSDDDALHGEVARIQQP